jgi:hypothetical protein
MGTKPRGERRSPKTTTPTFLLELPLAVEVGQAVRLRAHLEAGRQFYNAVLSAGLRSLRKMRADPAWREARAIPRAHTQERRAAFSALRERYGFSEYALHDLAKTLRVSWLADHLDAVLAQTLATRAYRALNRVCVGKARRVRFKSRGRGLSSLENKRNDTGLRFVLETQEDGRKLGFLLWHDDRIAALIDPDDPVIAHGLAHPIKYARLVRRSASSPRAQGADREGERYFVQLALAGTPYHKPKHRAGTDTVGLDLGPASIAIVPREAEARLEPLGQSFVLMREPSAVCSIAWSGKDERPILSTTTSGVGTGSEAKALPAGNRAMAIRSAGDASRPASEGWRPTARVCMVGWPTRSWRWATPSSPRSFPIKAGRNATAKAWDFTPQGC